MIKLFIYKINNIFTCEL